MRPLQLWTQLSPIISPRIYKSLSWMTQNALIDTNLCIKIIDTKWFNFPEMHFGFNNCLLSGLLCQSWENIIRYVVRTSLLISVCLFILLLILLPRGFSQLAQNTSLLMSHNRIGLSLFCSIGHNLEMDTTQNEHKLEQRQPKKDTI